MPVKYKDLIGWLDIYYNHMNHTEKKIVTLI